MREVSGITAELRERALRAEQEGEPIALLDEAANEIERLRSRLRLQDAAIRSGDVATLTDEERESIKWAAAVSGGLCQMGAMNRARTLLGILERLG